MEIAIFAKKRQTKDGRSFYSYLTTLTRKGGEQVTCSAKFCEAFPGPKPESCPINIIVDKADCNFTSKRVLNQATGEVFESNTIWINKWAASPNEWEDHSMDDFED